MNDSVLHVIGRTTPHFVEDVGENEGILSEKIRNSRFLVIGGAGSIGKAVTCEIFKRDPLLLDVVDISENNMVELVRDIRSSIGYGKGEFRTFAIDCASTEFEALFRKTGGYDYVLNLSALKHVRSEKDEFTLMRMIRVNIGNTLATMRMAAGAKGKKYFCVSTDKAANPVNMMGASKRIMELFLQKESTAITISTARFANVAFSDGSLLHGFTQRFLKRQPLSAPMDVRRYFVTPQESGELCLLSTLLGGNMEVFFPKFGQELVLTTFSDIAVRYLANNGYEAVACGSEEEARAKTHEMIPHGKWPCFFFNSDTTGEKDFEEFHTEGEELILDRFKNIGIVRGKWSAAPEKLEWFLLEIDRMLKKGEWTRAEIIMLFKEMLPEFNHKETGKFLDGRM